MVKRICTLLLILVMIAGCGIADGLDLMESTPAQKMLKNYMSQVNDFLIKNGDLEINKIFDQTEKCVELGVVSNPDDTEVFEPEGVAVTVYLNYDGI